MLIDNSTASFFSTLSPILNLIITAVVAGLIGYFVSKHFQNLNNMRQKVIEIDKTVFSDLRYWNNLTLRCLKDHDFFDWTYNDIRIRDTIRSENIEKIVLKSDIYEKKMNPSDSLIKRIKF